MRAEAEGVPPRDMENSDTGPSYIPLGTALRTASYGTYNKSRDGGGGERRQQKKKGWVRTKRHYAVHKRFNVTKSTPV